MLEEFVDLCRRAVPTPSEHGVRFPFGSRAAVCPACKNVAAHDGRFQLSAVSRLQDPDNPLLVEDTPWDVGPMGIHSSVFKDPLNGKWKVYLVWTPHHVLFREKPRRGAEGSKRGGNTTLGQIEDYQCALGK